MENQPEVHTNKLKNVISQGLTLILLTRGIILKLIKNGTEISNQNK